MTQKDEVEIVLLRKDLNKEIRKEDFLNLTEGIKERPVKVWERNSFLNKEHEIVDLFLEENELSLSNISKRLSVSEEYVRKTLEALGLI